LRNKSKNNVNGFPGKRTQENTLGQCELQGERVELVLTYMNF